MPENSAQWAQEGFNARYLGDKQLFVKKKTTTKKTLVGYFLDWPVSSEQHHLPPAQEVRQGLPAFEQRVGCGLPIWYIAGLILNFLQFLQRQRHTHGLPRWGRGTDTDVKGGTLRISGVAACLTASYSFPTESSAFRLVFHSHFVSQGFQSCVPTWSFAVCISFALLGLLYLQAYISFSFLRSAK